ncbi:hypothetical protein A4X09_0g5077 [Tilletia walkeri]|uniref:FYVE-type domain-containing protein n=1 Tax=Tilletia walkeri TaxID=117179 RepID=A0A8X7N7M7_9BASI|nr:hypothetical protein A4X09_0g5077 [Tilletia walkeri]
MASSSSPASQGGSGGSAGGGSASPSQLSRHSSSSSVSYTPYNRRSTPAQQHNRTSSTATITPSTGMGIYGSSPLAPSSSTGTGLPSSSSAASMLFPPHDYSGPSSRSHSPMPPSSSSSSSTSSSRPYSPALDSKHLPPTTRSSPGLPSINTFEYPSKQQPASSTSIPATQHTFQPKGLAVSRTADFMAARKRKQDGGRIEDGRLGRRLEKLLAIHHNPVPLADQSSATTTASTIKSSFSSHVDAHPEYDSTEEPLLSFASSTASSLRKASSNLWATIRVASSTTPSHPGQSFLSTLEEARTRAAEDSARRIAEQSIVKWQEDGEVRKCPVCTTAFSLAVRKHHCRLCGRVVCASPHLTKPIFPNIPNAAEGADQGTAASLAVVDPIKAASLLAEQKCSGLVVLTDPRTGKVDDARKVAAEAAVGAATVAEMAGSGGGGGGGGGGGLDTLKTLERDLDGRAIRICRDCRQVIFRQQYMLESGPTPTWLKLYEALMRLQREIEESLPEFHEMVLGLQKHDASTTLGSSARSTLRLQRDAAQARKQLLANFAAYDALAKRIRNLPTPTSVSRAAALKMNGGGKEVVTVVVDDPQERVQLAIWTNANLFLQKNMFPLQTLPKPDSRPNPTNHKRTPSSSSSVSASASSKNPTLSEQAATSAQTQEQLVVLREQQHLLEDYMARANASRKFEDARMLRMSWEEIEREVERLIKRAGGVGDPRRGPGRG